MPGLAPRGAERRENHLDVMYFEGPGDIVESFEAWQRGGDVDSQTSLTFSGHFLDFCKSEGLRARVYSHHEQRRRVRADRLWVETRPSPYSGSGWKHRFDKLYRGLFILLAATRYRPDDLHVTSGVTYWILLAPLRLIGIRIVAHMHNALWPQGFPPKTFSARVKRWMDAWFFRSIAHAALCVSPTLEHQIRQIAGSKVCQVLQFRAQFYPKDFIDFPPPPAHEQRPFRVLFAGRVESAKGVFDLLSMAETLRSEGVIFDICGGGASLEDLRREVLERGLSESVLIHGRLNRPALLERYKSAHAVIIPTRSEFCEGLPLACIEAVLVGRPQITSRLSNALEVLKGAIIEAEPDNPDSYAWAIRRLMKEPNTYRTLVSTCQQLAQPFLQGRSNLETALHLLD
jgi:glycosyltransferase involved in cell wall biosynthesis